MTSFAAQATFYYMAAACVVSALVAVTRKNPVHSMLWVLALFLHVAGIFLLRLGKWNFRVEPMGKT